MLWHPYCSNTLYANITTILNAPKEKRKRRYQNNTRNKDIQQKRSPPQYHYLALKALSNSCPSSPPASFSSTFSALSRISSISILWSRFLLSSSFLSSLKSSSAPNLKIADSSFYKAENTEMLDNLFVREMNDLRRPVENPAKRESHTIFII